jgi:VWFA-related protein
MYLGSVWAAEGPRIVAPAGTEVLVGDVVFVFEPATPDVERIDLFLDGRLIGTAGPPEWTVTRNIEATGRSATILAVSYVNGKAAGKTKLVYRSARVDEREYVDLVLLFPVVTDMGPPGSTHEYVTGLKREDFRVFEDDEEVSLSHFASEVSTLSIVLLLDVSESMSAKLGHVQVAASNFVDDLSEDDEVALYTFDHATRMLVEPTRDHDKAKAQIREISPGGGTALYDAIITVAGASLKNVPGRKVLFVFSDGVDRHSFATLDAAIEAVMRESVIVYAVGSADDDLGTTPRGDLKTLARRSGGEALFIRGPRDLESVFKRVLRDLRSQYELGFRPREGPSGERKIRVEVSGWFRQVRCRPSYEYESPDERSP